MDNTELKRLEAIAATIRRDIIDSLCEAGSGHIGGSLDLADIFTVLYFHTMKHNPLNPQMPDRDKLILSIGHTAPVLYATLANAGYFPKEELMTLRKIDGRLQGHPSLASGLPGIESASGSLGQGLSICVGMAISDKVDGINRKIFCVCGDGEIQEGQVWEALMYAGSKGVDNIILTVDYNHKQIDGNVEDVMSMLDLKAKFESFGWEVIVGEGNDMTQLLDNLEKARKATAQKKPVAFLMHTEMGYGVDFMCGNNKWRGSAPNDEQLASALSQIPETLGDY